MLVERSKIIHDTYDHSYGVLCKLCGNELFVSRTLADSDWGCTIALPVYHQQVMYEHCCVPVCKTLMAMQSLGYTRAKGYTI